MFLGIDEFRTRRSSTESGAIEYQCPPIETDFLTFVHGIGYQIIKRKYDIQPQEIWDYQLNDLGITDFINTGDASKLPARLVPIFDETDAPQEAVTRNMRLFNTETNTIIVINGFGYTTVEGQHPNTVITMNPPRIDKTYSNFMKTERGKQNLGTSVVSPIGRIIVDSSDGPLGAFSMIGINLKAGQMEIANSELQAIFPDVVFPKLLGRFRYGLSQTDSKDAYGLIYEIPPVQTLVSLCADENPGAIIDFVGMEYEFVRRLFDSGFVHNQLHMGNKGTTYDNKLYIGDMESLMSTAGYGRGALQLARYMALENAIRNDIKAVLGLKQDECINYNHLRDVNVLNLIYRAITSFAPECEDPEGSIKEMLRTIKKSKPKRIEKHVIQSKVRKEIFFSNGGQAPTADDDLEYSKDIQGDITSIIALGLLDAAWAGEMTKDIRGMLEI